MKAASEGPAVKVYDLTLSNVRVAGYAEDGGHDTAVAFNYRSGTETIREQKPDGTTDAGQTVSFGASLASVSHDTLAAFAHSDPGFPQVTSTIGSAANTAATSIDTAAAQNLALIGQYAASSLAVAGDSHGAPMIADLSPAQPLSLAQPHA